ncbi:Hsp20/alpha crystallin family protein [Citrifermentans bremense]|uniref:Hsp20/alpha crystallin family protein n=1 Tax=Citrifermentans bremense TaxID=60035 RepID=UPI000400E480|nr:Hsp20/alpha crystallin family protein [Citrifermentans bremense]
MAPNSLTERNDERNAQTREETRSNERYIRPAVNIVETEEGLFLTADLPGVAKGDIDVNVEKGILTITALAKSTLMGTPVYSEFQLGNYYRQFTIPESLDHEKAKADFVNGILTLRIPKAEIAKPRRIEVQIG